MLLNELTLDPFGRSLEKKLIPLNLVDMNPDSLLGDVPLTGYEVGGGGGGGGDRGLDVYGKRKREGEKRDPQRESGKKRKTTQHCIVFCSRKWAKRRKPKNGNRG